MYIVHISSECAPVAKAGGLGDVVYGLAKRQLSLGNHVEIILPKYNILDHTHIKDFSLEVAELWSFEDAFRYHNSVYKGSVHDLNLYFIEPHHNNYYFHRGVIYGSSDDIEQFLYFCRASLEFLHGAKKHPDIIHIHDWPTAAVSYLAHDIYKEMGFHFGKIVLTIHNLQHQGLCLPKNLTKVGLRGEDYREEKSLQDPQNATCINLLKGGIQYADQITTVSPRYAEEIQTEEFGCGLSHILQDRQKDLTGILNGIDKDMWNPSQDPHIFTKYPDNPTFISQIIENKQKNRKQLLDSLQMQQNSGPLLSCITRLAPQKGLPLILQAIQYSLDRGFSFILIGSVCEHQDKEMFENIRDQYQDTGQLHIHLNFDVSFAHKVYAASDAIVIPSLFEPCGLTQMIGMRYATVPIARKTGGLADTVFDVNDQLVNKEKRTGFTFTEPTKEAVCHTLDRVFHCYKETPMIWQNLMKNGMSQDYSWEKGAFSYQQIYERALQKKPLIKKL